MTPPDPNTPARVTLNALSAQALRLQALAEEAIEVLGPLGRGEAAPLDPLAAVLEALGSAAHHLRDHLGVERLHAPPPDGAPASIAPALEPPRQHSAAPTEIRREPWWAQPPRPGQTDEAIEWGYLVTYDNGALVFIAQRPSDEELATRTTCRLPGGAREDA